MDSMVPKKAVAPEMRPPRLRWFRSSTVNQWQTFPLVVSAKVWTSSNVRPRSFSLAHRYSSSPWPREAHKLSTTRILAWGNSPRRSSAAMEADW